MTGRSNSAATSRKIWIASFSSAFRCGSSGGFGVAFGFASASLRISDIKLFTPDRDALGGLFGSGRAGGRDGGGGGLGDVQAAFALLVVLPPPAAGALGLARLDGART